LKARGIEAFVIHSTSVAVPREHRRAKTDRLDTELLKRAFLGWLRGEPEHRHMAAIPTPGEEDARRPNRERENLIGQQTRIVNRMKACLVRWGIRSFKPTLRQAAENGRTGGTNKADLYRPSTRMSSGPKNIEGASTRSARPTEAGSPSASCCPR
jgi:transposase